MNEAILRFFRRTGSPPVWVSLAFTFNRRPTCPAEIAKNLVLLASFQESCRNQGTEVDRRACPNCRCVRMFSPIRVCPRRCGFFHPDMGEPVRRLTCKKASGALGVLSRILQKTTPFDCANVGCGSAPFPDPARRLPRRACPVRTEAFRRGGGQGWPPHIAQWCRRWAGSCSLLALRHEPVVIFTIASVRPLAVAWSSIVPALPCGRTTIRQRPRWAGSGAAGSCRRV